MWSLEKHLICALMKYPSDFGLHFLKHNKVSPTVTSETVKYGAHRLQRYDVHTIKDGEDLPTLFYIHGGAYILMDKKHYNYIVKTIAESGFRVVNINYRMLPKYNLSDIAEDCESAIAHAIENIPGINLNKLYIMGDSAGGHLSALIAAKANSRAYKLDIKFRAAVIIYGLFDMMDMVNGKASLFKFLTKYFRKEIGPNYIEYMNQFSPSRYFNSDFPPVFLASGKVDPLNPATMTFIDVLDKHKMPHIDIIYGLDRKDGQHGFFNLTFLKTSREVLKESINFLKEH
jgi:acetyl esterase/lipase